MQQISTSENQEINNQIYILASRSVICTNNYSVDYLVINKNNVIFLHNVTFSHSCAKIAVVTTFGERYKAWRKSKKGQKGKTLSNYHVSKVSGVARSNLTNMEKGLYSPSDDVLRDIAKVPELEITYAQLKAWQLLSGLTLEVKLAILQDLQMERYTYDEIHGEI